MTPMICIGHRGAPGYRPENTLPSFELALAMGCPWIELDVYAVEGELLVHHDDRLERTTNGEGDIRERPLAYLRGLDAGDGAVIPTLREVIALVDRRAGINVELKGPGTAEPVLALLDESVASGWRPDQFLISSFDHDELARARGNYPLGALFHRTVPDYFGTTAALGAWSLNLSRRIVDAATVTAAHARGLRVLVYTVNDADEVRRMLSLGVDGIFSDYPDLALETIASWTSS